MNVNGGKGGGPSRPHLSKPTPDIVPSDSDDVLAPVVINLVRVHLGRLVVILETVVNLVLEQLSRAK